MMDLSEETEAIIVLIILAFIVISPILALIFTKKK